MGEAGFGAWEIVGKREHDGGVLWRGLRIRGAGHSNVKVDGSMPMVKDVTELMMYSFNVKFDGKNACRLGDPLFHNKKNIMG